MKKTVTIIVILLLAAAIATGYGFVEDSVLRILNPKKYSDTVEKYSAEYGVPQEIIYAVMKTESSFKADAVSSAGAVGLMQLTGDTFSWLCTKTGENDNPSLLYEPETSIKYGTYYLSYLHNQYDVWETVLAAYNAGIGRVNEWLSDERYNNNGRLKDIPFPETSNYIKKVTRTAELYKRLYFEK